MIFKISIQITCVSDLAEKINDFPRFPSTNKHEKSNHNKTPVLQH